MVAFVNRRVLALVGLVLVSVAAISMSAATLTTATGLEEGPDAGPLVPTNISGQDPGGGPGGPGGENVLVGNSDSEGSVIQLSGCNDLLSSIPGTLLYFGALVGVLYLLKRRFSLGLTIFGGYALVPVALAVYFLRTDCVAAGGPGTGEGGLGETLSGQTPGPEVPPEIMLGVFAVLFVGVAVAVFLSSGEGEYADGDEDEEEDIEGTDVEDIAAAAANAAERLEERNADVDNEVYRAWWEMTQLLDVESPETYTPGQFAEAAIEVGIDEEHVTPLTTLFEEVRYGHEDAGSREDRAIEIFRAIDEEYGSETDKKPTADEQANDTDDTEDDQ